MLDNLPNEIENIIFRYLNMECHVCKRYIKSILDMNNIYKIQGKFMFCSKECYLFC